MSATTSLWGVRYPFRSNWPSSVLSSRASPLTESVVLAVEIGRLPIWRIDPRLPVRYQPPHLLSKLDRWSLANPDAYAFLSAGSVCMLKTNRPGTPRVVQERWQARQVSSRVNRGVAAA